MAVSCLVSAAADAGHATTGNIGRHDHHHHLVSLGGAENWRAVLGSLSADASAIKVANVGNGIAFEQSIKPIAAPAVLSFEMKTVLAGTDHHVCWVTTKSPGWGNFSRIPTVPNGQWRSYRVPLADAGEVIGVRFGFNAENGDVSVRNIEIESLEAVTAGEAGEQLSVSAANASLNLRFRQQSRTYELLDHQTGRTWQSSSLPGWVLVERTESSDDTIKLYLLNRFNNQRATLAATINNDHSLRFRLQAGAADDSMFGLQHLPPRFTTDFTNGKLVFCDRSCGVLLDQHDKTYSHWPLRVYGNTHCLDMPWVGVFDEQRGDGVLTLVETPADAQVSLTSDEEGRLWPQTRWMPSMDQFGYERVWSLHFVTDGGYVALAKRYRAILGESGKLRTLAEKSAKKPHLQRLKGAPILWANQGHQAKLSEARSLGVLRGVVNNCNRPQEVAWLKARGYLVGRYDSYSDILEGPVNFQRDNIERTAVRTRPAAPPHKGWLHEDGTQMSWRSSAHWLQAAAAYVPRQLAKNGHNARFVDVAVASEPMEDWAPQHTYDRRQDLRLRRDLLEYLDQRGLVLGTEHGNDWAVDLVDYHEGSLSGPFWWSSWRAGYLEPPSRDQLTAEYLKFGMGYANRIPLWQLVYHDCLVSTWYWGDNAGMLYHAAPELSDRKDLFTLLYGATSLLWMDERGYRWPENQRRWLRSHHDTCKFHEAVAFEQMTNHEFLSADRALQRTTFAGGAVATVNFSSEPRPLPDNPDVILAPFGYHVTAPNFLQHKLLVDNEPVTTIKSAGWLTVESNSVKEQHGVTAAGRLTIFQADPTRWNLVGEPGRTYSIDVARVTGWPAEAIRVAELLPDGSVGRPVEASLDRGLVTISTVEGCWRYVLINKEALVASEG